MTDFTDIKAPVSTVTVNRDKVAESTNNIYMAIVIIAKRAEQIQQEMKSALYAELGELDESKKQQPPIQEVYEDIDNIEISKRYERLPKPWAMALQEWLEGKIPWRFIDEEDNDKVF